MPDDDVKKPEDTDAESFEIGEDDVDEDAEATRQVKEALGQIDRADLDIGDGAREPEGVIAQMDFEAIEEGPGEYVSFGENSEEDEGEEDQLDLPPRRSNLGLIFVVVLANMALLSGAGYLFWAKYSAHQREAEAKRATVSRKGAATENPITQRVTRSGTPEREVEDPIRSRKLECQLTGIARDRTDPSYVTVHFANEYAFGMADLKEQIDRDATYTLKRVFLGVPKIQRITITCKSRIEVDKRGLNPKMAEAFRLTVSREQHAEAKYGQHDSLKKLGAKYHARLQALKPSRKPKAKADEWE